MRRMNNLVTLFTAMFAFFFGSFITTLLSNIETCPAHKSGVAKLEPHPEIFLLVLVLSAAQNAERRQTMRDTWLRLAQPLPYKQIEDALVYVPDYDQRGHLYMEDISTQARRYNLDLTDTLQHGNHAKLHIKVKHFFAVGTAGIDPALRYEVEREHAAHKDLLLLPRLQDTYANLTEKLLHALDALTHHHDFSYLLKVDDDTYVKLDALLNELVAYDRRLLRKAAVYHAQPQPQLYWGYFNGRAVIKTKGQWSESHYYLANRYVTYALGGGYVLSRQLCNYIAANAQHLTTYVSEDVSVGTWLSPLRHVYRRHDARFDTGYMPRKCRRQHLVLHKRSPALMRDLYAGKLCSFELANEQQLHRPVEYHYDWNKPADKCCDTHAV